MNNKNETNKKNKINKTNKITEYGYYMTRGGLIVNVQEIVKPKTRAYPVYVERPNKTRYSVRLDGSYLGNRDRDQGEIFQDNDLIEYLSIDDHPELYLWI